MERTKIVKTIPKPDAILCSDIHLRETIPTCRSNDFWQAQWDKLDFISELQAEYNCQVLHAGDLFHHWKPSPYLLSMAMEHLPERFLTIYGQHDLPQHSMELKEKSGIYTLKKAGKLEVLNSCSWGQTPDKPSLWNEYSENTERKILVWHNFTYMGKEPWPGCTATQAHILLTKYKQFDLLVLGDNHQSFTVRGVDGNLLVNPGSMTRQSADQIDFQPKVYLWYAEGNIVETVDIPIEKKAVTREHLVEKQELDKRIEAFVSRFKEEWEGYWDTSQAPKSSTFEESLERFFEKNRIRREVREIIYKVMED